MYEQHICALKEYIYKNYPDPRANWTKYHFKRRIWEQVVCNEVLRRCYDHYDKKPSDLIFDYELELLQVLRYVQNIDNATRIKHQIDVLEKLGALLV